MISPTQARDLLADVERTRRRSRDFLGYWRGGVYAQLWGVVWIAAHMINFTLPGRPGAVWAACDGIGIAATIWLRLREPRTGAADYRPLWALLILAAFGVMAATLIGPRPLAIEVFWTCLVMTGYMLYGLWAGMRWTVLGAAVCAASLLSYFYLRPWFDPVMALAGGGGLLLGGTWLRRAS